MDQLKEKEIVFIKVRNGIGIFVGNISFKCNEKDLEKFFSDYGKVVDVRIAKQHDGKLKCFAHVDFETEKVVEKTVAKNGKDLKVRPLKFDKVNSKSGGNQGNRRRKKFGGRGKTPEDDIDKAKRLGSIVPLLGNKVTVIENSSDDDPN